MLSNFPIDRRYYELANGKISGCHFGDNSRAVQLVMLHANGFNGLVYRSILDKLDVHSLALDLRGHGMSQLPTDIDGLIDWNIFRDDVTEFFSRYIDGPVILAGHSYGAVTGILAMPQIKEKVMGYVGFDPVMIPFLIRWPSRFAGFRTRMKKSIPIARAAGYRKSVFESYEAALTRYTGRGAFKGFSQTALEDYLNGGLKPHPDGVQLACDPLWEQAIFVAQNHNLFKNAKYLPANTHIISAGNGPVSTHFSRAKLRRRLRGGRLEFKKDFAHLFPMHEAAYSVTCLKEVLKKAGIKA